MKASLIKIAVFLFFPLLWPLTAQAIVNIEGVRHINEKDGFSGELEISVGGSSGNTEKLSTNIGTRIQVREGKQTDFLILRYAYGESQGKRDTDRSFLHVRRVFQFSAWRAQELFVQAARDEFSRLSFRGLIGAGERYTLNESLESQAYFGAGAFYLTERIEARKGTTDGGDDHFWRFNIYFTYTHQIDEQVYFLTSTYYQPVVDAFSDYRLREELTMSVKISGQFRLKVSLNIAHDSQPPQTVKKTDTIYSTGLEYRF